MANVQKQMLGFHENIKLKRFEENEVLREKRDRILDRLKIELKKVFDNKQEKAPTYETFDQGSYAMGTGVQPLDGEYDIDVGIKFKIAKDDYPDPVLVKEWVYDSLEGHTKKVKIRRPCVTVFYQQDQEPIYHVDLAIYSDANNNVDGKTYLATGKLNSESENRKWEESEPQKLIDLIKNHFSDDEDAKQFRRTIRYLKRWKDVKFSSNGNAAPMGIGITVAAYYWFKPIKTINFFENTVKYDDLEALKQFIETILNKFEKIFVENQLIKRLKVLLPVSPNKDVFKKMTDCQMEQFEEKLNTLLEIINQAQQETDPLESCKLLNKQFGEDFPIPSKEETAQKRSRSIISSSASA